MVFGFLRRSPEQRFFRKALVLQRDDPEHFAEILESMRRYPETMQHVTGFQGEEHFRALGWSVEDSEVAAVAAFLLSADQLGFERA